MQGLPPELLASLDAGRAMDHVRWLTANTPRRISGSGQDAAAAEYVARQMESFGLQVKMYEFPAYNSLPGTALLRVVEPADREVACVACAHIPSTPPGGVLAELVYVGPGGEADYESVDARGKVVLAEVSYAPATPEKARIAAARGAAGIVLMNWGESSCDAASMRALKAVWGNPTPDTWGLMPQIPAVSVSRRSGEDLISLCRAGRVRVRFEAESWRYWTGLKQPVGVLPGTRWPVEFVLVSGHLDAWEPGVTCNATGNGVMLELARVLATAPGGFARSIYFAFWNGHEIAEAAGSTWFVDRFWDQVRDGCVAYVNIDSPGLVGARRYQVSVSPELERFAVRAAERVLSGPVEAKGLGKTGDQSFFGMGVPAIAGRYAFERADLERTRGATLGWWNHTYADTLDKVDEGALVDELRVNASWVGELAGSPVLPYDPVALVDDLSRRLTHYQGGGPPLGLDSLAEELGALRVEAEKLRAVAGAVGEQGVEARAPGINRGLMSLSRCLTAAFRTTVPRWDQDTYGSSVLEEPVPILADLRLWAAATESERRLLETKLMRARNRLSDSVSAARAVLKASLISLERREVGCH